jgi:antitoxin (DNA-binding transcriptional repressor) of toxin-antitoxin stability system
MDQVALHDLRQHAGDYVRRARAGERIAVTDRGRVVAELGPPRNDAPTRWDGLVLDRELLPGRGRAFPEPLPPTTGAPTSEVLCRVRGDERR